MGILAPARRASASTISRAAYSGTSSSVASSAIPSFSRSAEVSESPRSHARTRPKFRRWTRLRRAFTSPGGSPASPSNWSKMSNDASSLSGRWRSITPSACAKARSFQGRPPGNSRFQRSSRCPRDPARCQHAIRQRFELHAAFRGRAHEVVGDAPAKMAPDGVGGGREPDVDEERFAQAFVGTLRRGARAAGASGASCRCPARRGPEPRWSFARPAWRRWRGGRRRRPACRSRRRRLRGAPRHRRQSSYGMDSASASRNPITTK